MTRSFCRLPVYASLPGDAWRASGQGADAGQKRGGRAGGASCALWAAVLGQSRCADIGGARQRLTLPCFSPTYTSCVPIASSMYLSSMYLPAECHNRGSAFVESDAIAVQQVPFGIRSSIHDRTRWQAVRLGLGGLIKGTVSTSCSIGIQ